MVEYGYKLVKDGEIPYRIALPGIRFSLPWEYHHHSQCLKDLMRMFLGEYQPNLTEGSRVALPKKLRDQITGDEVILSRGFEKCIFIYAKEDWVSEASKQVESPITDIRTRDIKRYMYASATESAIDTQGRIVIPTNLKSYAGIEKQTTVIGAGDHIEVWDAASWDAHLEKISKELAA